MFGQSSHKGNNRAERNAAPRAGASGEPPARRTERRPQRAAKKVPVAHREVQGRSLAATGADVAKRLPQRLDIVGFAVLTTVLLIILITIAMPLRNYYQGRTEIARLHESIAAKKAEKERLLNDIEKYRDEGFIEEEARRRLGVVAPGETAYRILDPRVSDQGSLTTDKHAEEDQREWYAVLWESVAEDTRPPAS